MTSKQIEEPSVESFDEWTDEQETQAIEAIGESLQNKYQVIGQNLWVLMPNGHRYKMPLNVDVTIFTSLDKRQLDPVDQVRELIRTINPDDADRIANENFINVVALSYKYADVFEKVQGATLGKLKASASSSKPTTSK